MDEEIGREQKAVKIYATRMVAARKMAGINQVNAAKMLGFSNSSNLSKIESGERQVIPLYIIIDAAKIYHTTTDYLLGLTDDWDEDNESRMNGRVASMYLYEFWDRVRERDMCAVVSLDKKIREVADKGGTLGNEAINLLYWLKNSGVLAGAPMEKQNQIMAKVGSLHEKAAAFRRMMEKLKLHKKDNVNQMAFNLISSGAE